VAWSGGGEVRALTVRPGVAGSAIVEEVPEPPADDGPVLVDTLAVGVCGTDLEIVAGEYGDAPPGEDRLVLGHESLGRVRQAPADSGLVEGDLVVGIVRRPDPVPCPSCAVGEWDMCRNGRYTEHGIKGLHGFAREQYRVHPDFAVRLDSALARVGVLLEPTTVVAKAWDHIERIGHRVTWEPRRVLVTGAGPIGLLAALLSVQRGLETHVLDRVTGGAKPRLTRALGAWYHSERLTDLDLAPDVIIECTGAPSVVMDVMGLTGHDGIVCLAGVSPTGRRIVVDAGALDREIVLQNDVVFGTVNANRRHYELGAEALAKADDNWLEQLITRRVPLDRYAEALQRREDDIKVVLDIAG
jgi:threonine dehydrogenase-like Zn-dependent dehydrogenase